jgi:hypothetical protein
MISGKKDGATHIDILQNSCRKKESWSQIEIVTRHLALHIDSVLEAYYPAARPHISQKGTTFAERILVMQRLQLLRDYVSQLYWWLNALFGA